MKKLIISILILAIVISGVLVYRANTVFENRQAEPAAGMTQIELDRDLALSRFAEALTYPTVSHDDRSNFDAAAFEGFHAFLERAYPRFHQQAERHVINDHSLVYHLPGSDPSLKPVLFMGHMDVVPVEDISLDQWTHPPFSGTVDRTTIWGRGSVDDKLTVIALMEAAEHLVGEGVTPRRSIYFAFGHDEEVGGKDGAGRVAEYFKQLGISFEFVLDEGGAITSGMTAGLDRPLAVVGVSEKGYVNLNLTVDAEGGHSSQPPPQTALGILARAIVRVEDSPFPARLDQAFMTFEHMGSEMPFKTRLAMGNLWLFGTLVKRAMAADPNDAAAIRTTTAATMASGSPKSNILPTRATAVINFRILPGDTVETVRERVIEAIDDERVEVSAEYAFNPSPVSPTDSLGYQLIASTIRGMDESIIVAPYMVRGGTDAKYFYDLSPNVYRFMMLRIDPDTIRYIHGIDERVKIDGYMEAIQFFYHLLRQSMNP